MSLLLSFFVEKFPAQPVTLAVQVAWVASVESAFQKAQSLDGPLGVLSKLSVKVLICSLMLS